MLADRLRKAWDDRRKSTTMDAVMRFSEGGLVLGAGTGVRGGIRNVCRSDVRASASKFDASRENRHYQVLI